MKKCPCGLVARVLFGLPFVVFGLFHLLQPEGIATMVPEWLPGRGNMYVYLSGLVMLLGGGSILLSQYEKIGSNLLIGLLLLYILLVHLPAMQIEATRQMSMVSLLKDTALIGGAFMFARRHCKCGGDCAECKSKSKK
ncbi:DoxX family membrane protein [Candidatus Dojkabacteria bacterium]|uniref:DoxX family membrane protein n=1 Tax=Candidatus Dojkabacteria bacterium TaxID=2099670 RepID=A0A955L8I1_9BACT|nr:DoxX family membrane protein [Candidatus Dojkabacteria bacterium]